MKLFTNGQKYTKKYKYKKKDDQRCLEKAHQRSQEQKPLLPWTPVLWVARITGVWSFEDTGLIAVIAEGDNRAFSWNVFLRHCWLFTRSGRGGRRAHCCLLASLSHL